MPDDAGTLRVGWGTHRPPGNPLQLWVSGPTDAVTILPIGNKPANPPVVGLYVTHGPSGGMGGMPGDPLISKKVTVAKDAPAHVFGLTITLAGTEEDADGSGGYIVLEIDPPQNSPWH